MSDGQATLAMTGERRIDEHGAADRWDRGGVYDKAGEFDLEGTKSELADRFRSVSRQLPEQVGEYTRDPDPREPYTAVYRWSGGKQDVHGWCIAERAVRVFPRGPYLNQWTVGIDETFATGGTRSFLHSHAMGLDRPSAAAATAIAVMQGKVPVNSRHQD
ncbi:hypothetical protein [Haloarcula marismortui]|uniref:Uncharacterized protein n=1 Tax=Haloarcula marismortui ATCC 33799 TaxID=662475 RepID=M0JNI3_9EURY|nr:hypothetical protein [Haloarcula californiae]EMA09499.1 hypothetical protein C435_22064 [Haloarcula californiae ATCC 33799]